MGETVNWGPYQWDSDKAAENERKHGISFKRVTTLFAKGLKASAKTVDGQARFMMIGEPHPPVEKTQGGDNIWKAIFTIVKTKDGSNNVRIISVHPVNEAERTAYTNWKAGKADSGGTK